MFRIEFFCEDKHLAAIMRGISGKARDLKSVPVAGSENGSVPANGGTLLGLLVEYIKENKLTTINRMSTEAFLNHVGRSPASYSYILTQATKAGILRKRGKGQRVEWVIVEQPKPRPSKKGAKR